MCEILSDVTKTTIDRGLNIDRVPVRCVFKSTCKPGECRLADLFLAQRGWEDEELTPDLPLTRTEVFLVKLAKTLEKQGQGDLVNEIFCDAIPEGTQILETQNLQEIFGQIYSAMIAGEQEQ